MFSERNDVEYVHLQVEERESVILSVTVTLLDALNKKAGAYEALENYVRSNKERFSKNGNAWDGTWLCSKEVYGEAKSSLSYQTV